MPLLLIDKETFIRKLDRITDIPTLPVVALKVNKMLMDTDVSVHKLSETIEKDHAMVSKILRLVNSAFYGFQSRIDNISHAITILGLSTVRNAVLSISVVDAFSDKEVFEGFSMSDFWKHSLAVAVTARQMANRSRLATPDEVFVAGILHDVGKLVLAQHYQALFRDVWIATQDQGMSFHKAEESVLPVDHAHIGGTLAKKWHLPENLVDAITYHHAFGRSEANLNEIMTICASDFVVNNYWNGSEPHPGLIENPPRVGKALTSELQTVAEWFPSVATEIEDACSFFMESEE